MQPAIFVLFRVGAVHRFSNRCAVLFFVAQLCEFAVTRNRGVRFRCWLGWGCVALSGSSTPGFYGKGRKLMANADWLTLCIRRESCGTGTQCRVCSIPKASSGRHWQHGATKETEQEGCQAELIQVMIVSLPRMWYTCRLYTLNSLQCGLQFVEIL